MTGIKNSTAIVIEIYNAKNELMDSCYGIDFKSLCDKNNYPFSAFNYSRRNDSEPLYEYDMLNKIKQRIKNRNFWQYKGWYAKSDTILNINKINKQKEGLE